jgi:hypothetical protein
MQISVQCMGVYIVNFRRWNYNCAFYYYYLIMEKIYLKNKQEQYFTLVGMGNLQALLPHATPLVSRFFAEMSNKCQF